MLGTASTDAVNRAPSTSYSEVTGITQTARNFGASLGLAILGAILVSREPHEYHQRADQSGRARAAAHKVAGSLSASRRRGLRRRGSHPALVHDVQLAFAHSTQTVFYIMAGVMAASFLVAVRRLPRGRIEPADEAEVPVSPAGAGA